MLSYLRRFFARRPLPPQLEPLPEGYDAGDWIDWTGDRPCPLEPGTLFQPRYLRYHRPAPVCEAGAYNSGNWMHTGETLDIMAYRLVKRRGA